MATVGGSTNSSANKANNSTSSTQTTSQKNGAKTPTTTPPNSAVISQSSAGTAQAKTLQTTAANVKQALNSKLPTQAAVDEAVRVSANRVKEEAQNDPKKAGETLVAEINKITATYGKEAAAKLIEQLNKDDKKEEFGLANVLTFAGNAVTNQNATSYTQVMGNNDSRKNLGEAMSGAYKNMSADDKKGFVEGLTGVTQLYGLSPNAIGFNNKPTAIAELVAAGSNNDFKKAMVDSLVKSGSELGSKIFGNNNGGGDIRNLYNSAAIIAASGDKPSQVSMFNSITKSFSTLAGDKTQMNEVFGDKDFKDRMSQIFLNNSKDILNSPIAPNGRFKDSESLDGMVKFFEMALFSKDGGKLRDAVKGELIKDISQLTNGSFGSGRDKAADSYLAGSLIGVLQSAAVNQKDSIKDSQKEREATAKFFVGVGFAFVPGADKILGEGAGKVLEVAFDKAKDFAKDHAESQLSKYINNMSDGNALQDIKALFTELRELRFSIDSNLPKDLADSFDIGYAVTSADQLLSREIGR
jgi:hypothetical protein